jgi:PAS domain S-box-containing protein
MVRTESPAQIPQSTHHQLALVSGLLESSTQIAFITDANGQILHANRACVQMLGYHTDDLCASLYGALFDLTDDQRARLEQCAAQKIPCLLKTKARRADGTTLSVHLAASPRGGQPDAQGMVFLASDTSDLEQAEEKLRLIFDHAFDGISLYRELDGGTRVLVDCNRRYTEMAGQTRDALLEIGNTLPLQKSLTPMVDRGPFLTAVQTGHGYQGRFSWIRPDGRDNIIEYNAMPIQVNGQVLTIGLDRDITDRVRTEQALRQQRDFSKAVVEMASEGILVTDREGTLYVYNQRMEEITGYSLQEAESGLIELLYPDADLREQEHETLGAAWQSEQTNALEREITRKNGERRHILVSMRRFTHGDQPLLLSVIYDITEHKQAEATLREKTLQQAKLIETARHLTASLDVNEVLRRIGIGAREILAALGCALYILEQDGRTLTPVVVVDPLYEQEILAQPLNVETSFTGRAVLARRGLIYNDAGGNDTGHQIAGTPVDEEEHIIVAPFVAGGQVLGAICLNRNRIPFSQEDLSLVETFATYAVTALTNAQSHNDLQSEVEERRRTESVLREAEERYRTTIDAMDDIVHVVDRDLRIVLCNRSLQTKLIEIGKTGDPLGKNIFEVFPFLTDRVHQEYQQALTSGTPLLTEEQTLIGQQIYYTETRKIPVLDHGSNVNHIVTIVRDITERKQMDQVLGYRLMMEELVTAISTRFIRVAQDDIEDEIRLALQAMGEFVGVDRCYLHLFSEDLREIERAYEWSAEGIAPREEALAGLSTSHMAWAMEKKKQMKTMHVPRVADLPSEANEAKKAWLAEGIQSILSIPLALEDVPVGALGFNSLTSEKRWTDEDIRILELVGNALSNVLSRQRAEQEKKDLERKLGRARLMESLGLLAGGVAHDLNNLLGPLVAYPELILDDLPANSPCREDVLRIQHAAEKAVSVVQDLLTLARRGAHRMSPLFLDTLVREYLRSPTFSDLQARYPAVTVDIDLNAELPIMGSSPHLSKAIMNLVINAFEAMPEGGKLTIGSLCHSFDRAFEGYEPIAAGDYVVLYVSDTGIGISEEERSQIFEPFYSKKEMGQSGSGLGLSVVQGVMQDHKGRIDLLSAVGKGTTFLLYLPITGNMPVHATKANRDYGGDESILVVDDMQAQRELAVRLLSSMGYKVTAVASGRAAVDYLRNHTADIVILDMLIEDDFDGLDTYREIARIHPGQKAVIASGFSETARIKTAQQLGAGIYLRKPYTLYRLGEAVREELDRDPASSQTSS